MRRIFIIFIILFSCVELRGDGVGCKSHIESMINAYAKENFNVDISSKIVLSNELQKIMSNKECKREDLRIANLFLHKESRKFECDMMIECAHIMKNIRVTGGALYLEKVLSFAKNLHNGHIISDEDLEYKLVARKDIREDFVEDITDVIGKAIKRSVANGDVVRKSAIGSAMLIRRNDIVYVTYKSDAIIAQMKALSMENGALGERVKLKNQSSNKIFYGKVAGKKKAEIVNE